MSKVDNEELLQQLQRVSVLARRGRRAQVKKRIIEEGKSKARNVEGKCGHRASRNAVAFGDTDNSHNYGNHKCHGGSGRHGQNRVLAVLALQDGINQKDLAYILGVRPQSLDEALSKLEESKLITLDLQDGSKAKKVSITDAGRGRVAKVQEDRQKTAADVFQVLSDDEKAQLASIFEKLSGSLEQQLTPKQAA